MTIILLSIVWFFGTNLLDSYRDVLDVIIGISLISIGIFSLLKEYNETPTPSQINESAIFGFGILNGFVTNDEILVLLIAGLNIVSFNVLLVGIGLFALGVILGVISIVYLISTITKYTKYFAEISASLSILTGMIILLLWMF